MFDSAPPSPPNSRMNSLRRQEDLCNTPSDSDCDTDGKLQIGHSSANSDLPLRPVADAALLHLLDGYFVKRHSIEPWNTSGGYCDVFTGDHPVFGKVALKRPRMTGDRCTASQLRSFASEGQLWKELRHPNVLQFVGMIESNRHIWLVSIFAENGSLHEYIDKYPGADRFSLVLQFTSGLAYLHSKNVVHGDLKSSNLFVSINHNVLIGDFGLSKLVGTGIRTPPSKQGAGSYQWMAPELMFEDDPIKTFPSDVYAYGITLSEIIRSELPFNQFTNPLAFIRAMSNNNLRPPTSPQKSPEGKSYAVLWAVAEVCWDADPSKRPSMFDVFSRLSLNISRIVDDVTTGGAVRIYENSQRSSPADIANTRFVVSPLIQHMHVIPPSVDQNTLEKNTNEHRLLQLLGNAEHGDIGHMKDDGLCLVGTRVEILGKLDAWADDELSPRVMLLKGQAGRGKSTIVRSVSSRFRKHWGGAASSAIFHFRRNNETLNSRLLLALARQLGSSGDQRLRMAILEAVQDHQDVAQLRLEEQFDILLAQPIDAIEPGPPRILLVIDALDECSDHSLISALLRLIQKHAMSLPPTVKFLLTSRPEEHVMAPSNASINGAQEDLDTVDVGLIDRDVRLFFKTRLSEIQEDFGLDAAWVSQEAINELVSLSQGLFQWADAAIEYVRERPRRHLQHLVRSSTVALGLPALYRQILSTAFPVRKDVKEEPSHLALIQHVLGLLVVSPQPISPAILAYLWDYHPNRPNFSDPAPEISEDILGRLGSILILPKSPDDPIHFMHVSVRDFFANPDQCEDTRFLITSASHHAPLADICFRRMKDALKHDICGISDPSRMNSEVVDLVEQRIPSGLRYCCRSWSIHLSGATDDRTANLAELCGQLDEFCAQHLLHWLEVLSLISVLSEVFNMVYQAREWSANVALSHFHAVALTDTLLCDTNAFCRRFFRLMMVNAQHISLSYLLHFSNDTALRNVYASSIGPQKPRIIHRPAHRRPACSHTIRAGSSVNCIAFTPDAKTLASGSDDGTIRLWNTDMGEQIGEPFVGHNGPIKTLAISPDGQTLASGSSDSTIRLCVIGTRKERTPFIGHKRGVTSIAFSPDGTILASGSNDETIRLWDIDSDEHGGTVLMGHKHRVRSVAFSPDGKTLASGSDDRTIRLWLVNTGEQKGKPLVGHTDWVGSVVFSPDGETLASTSGDKTIRLWVVVTGESPIVTGHFDLI